MLRNIAYDMKETHLRKEFAKFGKIIDVNLPEGKNGMNRGFAFIEFNSKEEGEKMLKEMNGKQWKGRTIAVAFSLPKASYEHRVEHLVKHTNMTKEEASLPKVLRDEKKRTETAKEKLKVEEEQKKKEKEKMDKIRAKKKAKKAAKEEKVPKKDNSCTLFVRNIGFETNQEKFKEFMQRFGDLAYAVLCKGEGEGPHRGSGFVKFKRREDAQQLLELSTKVEDNLDKERRNFRL